MATKRTAEEIQRLLEGYRRRTVTRVEYCHQEGISAHVLDYYLRRQKAQTSPRLARVKVGAATSESRGTFALLLRNGRRIESAWSFRDADLTRLIRVAESD